MDGESKNQWSKFGEHVVAGSLSVALGLVAGILIINAMGAKSTGTLYG